MNITLSLKSYLENKKNVLISAHPKHSETTVLLLAKTNDFLTTDFSGVSENHVYRHFLEHIKDIVQLAFEANVSKAYLQDFFNILSDNLVIRYIADYVPRRCNDIKQILNQIKYYLIHWQDSDKTKDKKLMEIISIIHDYI